MKDTDASSYRQISFDPMSAQSTRLNPGLGVPISTPKLSLRFCTNPTGGPGAWKQEGSNPLSSMTSPLDCGQTKLRLSICSVLFIQFWDLIMLINCKIAFRTIALWRHSWPRSPSTDRNQVFSLQTSLIITSAWLYYTDRLMYAIKALRSRSLE